MRLFKQSSADKAQKLYSEMVDLADKYVVWHDMLENATAEELGYDLISRVTNMSEHEYLESARQTTRKHLVKCKDEMRKKLEELKSIEADVV